MPLLSPDKERSGWLIPLLVSAVTFLVFLPALRNGFVNWDDTLNLVENLKYRGLDRERLRWMFTSFGLGPYTPLANLSFGFDYLAWGMNPSGYHLTSVLIHCANALLFYLLCFRLLARAAKVPPEGTRTELELAAAGAALFFALHPLRVESVAWLSGRHDLLCTLFCLLAVLLYTAPRAPGAGRTSFFSLHLLPLLAFLPALLSKATAVTLPLVLLLLDIYPLGRLPADPRRWRTPENRGVWLEKTPYFALSLLFGIVAFIGEARVGSLLPYKDFGFSSRAAQTLYALVFYPFKTLAPLKLSPFYQLPHGFGLLSPAALAAGAALAAVTAGAFAARRRWPAAAAAWAFYLATIWPVAGLFKVNLQSAADRYAYFPCLGFAALAGAGLLAARRAASSRVRYGCSLLACLVIAGCARLTWRQEGVWLNSEALWTHTLALDPEQDFAQNNFGSVLAAQGKPAAAAEHFRKALQLNPDYAFAHYNLGGLLAAQGRNAEAAEHYTAALRINPRYEEAHANLGSMLAAQGRFADAAAHYRAALQIKPAYAFALFNLGVVTAKQGDAAAAEEQYRAAIKLDPAYAPARYNLGVLLAAGGRSGEAAEEYRAALRCDPAYAEAHGNLGSLLSARGELAAAAEHYRAALRLKPDYALAHYNLGVVLAAQGALDAAAEQYRAALALNPGLGEARDNLRILSELKKK
ncbi:MAG TPA: tetratricopeptide repeat protein [Elusimicrobiales bacterium]|nr:tetratricopeptide repeat protein [Elusimicrobiales bacterium]